MKKSLLAVSLFLSGCMLNQETRMTFFEDTCSKYGYEKGTDKFMDCMRDENRAWFDRLNSTNKNISSGFSCQTIGMYTNCH